MRCPGAGLLCMALVLSSASGWGLSSDTEKEGPTIEVPLQRLKKWQASLLTSAESLKRSESYALNLKKNLSDLNKNYEALQAEHLSLRLDLQSSLLSIENLRQALQRSELNFREQLAISQELQTTSASLSAELKRLRARKIRDLILAALGGLGAGTIGGVALE